MTELKDLVTNPNSAELALVARYGALEATPVRERAFGAFAENGLPHRRMEAFKWTDFKAGMVALEMGRGAEADLFAEAAGPVIRMDGTTVQGLDDLPAGMRVIVKDEAHAFAAAEDVPLGALTAALTAQTVLIDVTESPAGPIRLVYAGAGEAAFSRLSFTVRPGVSLELIESHLGGAGLNASLIGFDVKEGARVSRTLIQPPAPGEAMVMTSEVHVDAGAHYEQTVLAFGADIARIETRGTHHGEDARLVLNAAYLAGDGYHVDFTSHVRHGARACVTRQKTKGAVLDGGTGVFQGKFHVPRNVGQQTDADMQHNALLLEDGAVVNAKPELEIYADDVECAHGNTCGALDADALFYMRQRGIPETVAKALLTEAFIAEALETAHESVRGVMLETARGWLAG